MSWKDTLKAVAPTLAKAIGGPFGSVAVAMATKALGIENKEDELEKALATGSPDVLIQLKTIEAEFKTKMEELDVKVMELDVQDRDSARSLAKDKGIATQVTLSIVYSIGYFILVWAFVSGNVEVSVELKSEFNIVLGVLTTAQIQIMNFWFGSSEGSKRKDSPR